MDPLTAFLGRHADVRGGPAAGRSVVMNEHHAVAGAPGLWAGFGARFDSPPSHCAGNQMEVRTMTDESWLCECDDPAHGELGCTRSADEDETRCALCQDGIHDDESI